MIVAADAAQPPLYEADPSEMAGDWTKPQMQGYLTQDAAESKPSSSTRRYFVLVDNFLMCYQDARDSVFHPKGVWCLDDCRKGFMTRPGLHERQAVLLRGKRELVITADSNEDLMEWSRAVKAAAKITQCNLNDAQRSADAELSKLRSHRDSML
eukprot:6849514-Prymnesium_polylepis.2